VHHQGNYFWRILFWISWPAVVRDGKEFPHPWGKIVLLKPPSGFLYWNGQNRQVVRHWKVLSIVATRFGPHV
jgi:hypothetical protein